jgi:hypothetical protein
MEHVKRRVARSLLDFGAPFLPDCLVLAIVGFFFCGMDGRDQESGKEQRKDSFVHVSPGARSDASVKITGWGSAFMRGKAATAVKVIEATILVPGKGVSWKKRLF